MKTRKHKKHPVKRTECINLEVDKNLIKRLVAGSILTDAISTNQITSKNGKLILNLNDKTICFQK